MDSKVLASSHDWVRAFSNLFEEIRVLSTHVGRTDLPDNVKVIQIGGGTLKNRLSAILILFQQISFIFQNRENLAVFHHMTTYPAAILGPILRALGIRQSIWYSHSHASKSFRWAAVFMNRIYGPAPGAVPANNTKIRYLGHGIDIEKFTHWDKPNDIARSGLVSVGRIVPIKNFHLLLSDSFPAAETFIDLYGPSYSDNPYHAELLDLAFELGINLRIHNPIGYSEMATTLQKYSFFYSGTPKSVDKAAVEASLSGCFIVSSNQSLLEVTGMNLVWSKIGLEVPISIFDQLRILIGYQGDGQLRKLLSHTSAQNNNLNNLVRAIANDFIIRRA
jgi:glycosyltransferase involved in cell wall biosynthesis